MYLRRRRDEYYYIAVLNPRFASGRRGGGGSTVLFICPRAKADICKARIPYIYVYTTRSFRAEHDDDTKGLPGNFGPSAAPRKSALKSSPTPRASRRSQRVAAALQPGITMYRVSHGDLHARRGKTCFPVLI